MKKTSCYLIMLSMLMQEIIIYLFVSSTLFHGYINLLHNVHVHVKLGPVYMVSGT